MHLEKTVPEHTKRIEFEWVARYWMRMSERFREVRRESIWASISNCFCCEKKFDDGEMMAIARRTDKGNAVLCQKCADELERTGDQDAD